MTQSDALLYRVAELERRIQRLEDFEPARVKQQIEDLQQLSKAIAEGVRWLQRTLIGFCVTFSLAAVGTTVLLLQR